MVYVERQSENYQSFLSEGKNTIMKEAESLFGIMREATYEEQASVNKYINSISKETGIEFNDSQKIDNQTTEYMENIGLSELTSSINTNFKNVGSTKCKNK